MMEQKSVDVSNVPSYTWSTNCLSFVLLDAEGLSVKQERMPPGAKEKLHFHARAQQFFYVLKGSATFYLNGERVQLQEQQGLHVENGKQHYIENAGSKSLEFLVISQPGTENDRFNLEQ